MNELFDKIKNGDALIGIIGLGYVGLPLGIAFSKKFQTIGYDINERYIADLISGKSHIIDVPDNFLKECVSKSLHPTSDPKELQKCDFIIICVPTPLTEQEEPDLTYVKDACNIISDILSRDQFIILESTTYPGTTEDIVLPILEKTGLKAGLDFGLAYSPERIDPGNKEYTVENTPKIVGGINDQCTEIALALYKCIISTVFPVKNARTAEAVKIVENIFRNVNIALVNELSLIFEKMNIDAWEVIDAAATKPYGFMPFYPGPGIGGHCIPLDPYYMSYKAKKYGFIPRFIETSGEINNFMKMHAINLVEKGLEKVDKDIYGSRIAVMGLAYKKNINDTRESPSIKIIEEIVNLGAEVKVYDPHVESILTKYGIFKSEKSIDDAMSGMDCSLFVVDHDEFRQIDIGTKVRLMILPLVVDCKNIFKNDRDQIEFYLGLGKA
jgi:UDP-N-acetyl-D-glucosamine dehydrogenase